MASTVLLLTYKAVSSILEGGAADDRTVQGRKGGAAGDMMEQHTWFGAAGENME